MFDTKEEQAKYRLSILNAIQLFLNNPHEIIDIGLESQNTQDFKDKLKAKYSLNDEQAQVIADVQVKRITKVFKEDFRREIEDLIRTIQ